MEKYEGVILMFYIITFSIACQQQPLGEMFYVENEKNNYTRVVHYQRKTFYNTIYLSILEI